MSYFGNGKYLLSFHTGFDFPLTDDIVHFLLITGHLRMHESALSTPFPVNDFTLTSKLTFHHYQNLCC